MNALEYISKENVMINHMFKLGIYDIYHTNSNITLFTIDGEIEFAIKGSNIEPKNILQKEYFEDLQKV